MSDGNKTGKGHAGVGVTAWKKVSEKELTIGHRRVMLRRYLMPDGREQEYDLLHVGDIVCVFPLTADNKVILAKQYRPGPDCLMLELPGGFCEAGEAISLAAHRELLEETGYSGRLSHVSSCSLSAYVIGQRHVFVARDCIKVGEQKLDENEFIEVVEMPVEDFKQILRAGELTDIASGFICLDHLGLV